VSFRGMRLFDATLAEAIPVAVPRSSATDMLVLQTRPHGVTHSPLKPLVARLTDRYLHAINPALVELRQTRSARYDALTAELAAQAADPEYTPATCVIRPPSACVVVGQLEHRASVLQTAAGEGLRSAWMALEGEDPEVIGTLRAYPPRRGGESGGRSGSDGGDPAAAAQPGQIPAAS
jgi:predicted patatin/cPLA2 family phospholipase